MRQALVLLLLAITTNLAIAEDKVDFTEQIQPIFVEHCAKCHGEDKAKGDVRLHNPAAIREAGIDHLLNPAKPDEGELLARITLPAGDDLLMPKGGDPLAQEQIDLIRKWIEQGAEMPEGSEPVAVEEDPLPDVPPAAPEAVEKLVASGAQVLALYQDSPLLRVTFAYSDEKAGDEEAALLTAVAKQVIWLNLAQSEITNAGTAPLATLENLTHLHLELTALNDEALAHLAGLQNLKYLNLYGTQVTDAGLEHLKGLKKLKKLYLWQTPISYEAAMALQDANEGLEVNLGWNHPEVAKRRLAKELERVTSRKEDATKREEQAKAEKEAAVARETEIQKELEALNPKPAEESEEKPAEEKPAEEKPAEEKPAEEKPAEEKPAEEKPAEEKPAEEKPAEEKPAEEKPAEEKPAEEKPAE
jgi:mono/diheme cytochrome c family protein